MRSVLDYVIRVMKEGKGDRETIDTLKTLKSTMAAVTGGIATFVAAMYTVDKVLDATVGKYAELGTEIESFQHLTGMSAESSSRLVEVMKDLGISAESVQTAFKFAEKSGFEPTIESLQRMQAEYNNLAPGMERTQFLLENFGKSGTTIQKFFETGDIAQRLAEVNDAMVFSEDDFVAIQEYKDAVDELADTFESAKLAAGAKLAPAVTSLTNYVNQSIGVWSGLSDTITETTSNFERFTAAGGKTSYIIKVLLIDLYALGAAGEMVTAGLGATPDFIDSATSSYMGWAESIENARDTMSILGTEMVVTNELIAFGVEWTKNANEVDEKRAEILKEIAEAEKADYENLEEKATKLAELRESLTQFNSESQTTKDQALFEFLAKGLAETNPEMLWMVGNALGVIDDQAAIAFFEMQKLMELLANLPATTSKKVIVEILAYFRTFGEIPDILPGQGGSDETNCCFAAGTLVLMADGSSKPIEQIKIGDLVLSDDGEIGKGRDSEIAAKVIKLFSPIRSRIFEIVTQSRESIKLTDDHPLLTDKGWAAMDPKRSITVYPDLLHICQLRVGEDLFKQDHTRAEIMEIREIVGSVQTYSFQLDEYHIFYANGFVTHNAQTCWTGGMLGSGAFVGDAPGGGLTPYTEYVERIAPDRYYVHNAQETRAMVNSGAIRSGQGFAEGGMLGGGSSEITLSRDTIRELAAQIGHEVAMRDG